MHKGTACETRAVKAVYFGDAEGSQLQAGSDHAHSIDATSYHFGDRIETWLIVRDAEGRELNRVNAAKVETIVWMEPIPA